MSLSKEAKEILVVALANRKIAEEVAAAIDASGSGPAAAVAAIAPSDLSVVSGTYAIPAEPTGAEVDVTVQALADEVETRLDNAEAKINEVIAALKAASLMSV